MSSPATRSDITQQAPGNIEDILPHLRTTIFITGAFVVAWSWDLVVYALSHVWFGESPLDNQLAFGNKHAPKHLWVLLTQYLVVCGGAASLSNTCRRRYSGGYREAVVMAIEFFPSPVFAGKLMAYLTQFQRLQPVQQALLNLAATWFSAFLAQLAVSGTSNPASNTVGFWQRTGLIIRDTLGFGLGIAWNALLAEFGPRQDSELNLLHILALFCYLLMVLVLALKLAAMVDKTPVDSGSPSTSTIWDQHLSLLSFAMYVVCGFTLVGFLNTFLGDGWMGSLMSFGICLLLAAFMSALVAVADLDGLLEKAEGQGDEENGGAYAVSSSWEYKPSKFGAFGGILNFCIFVPCVWCCCPWVPILILLAGMTESVNVKEHWFRLIAMVAGLSSSIEGSSMLTNLTDTIASILGICGTKHCREPWLFVALQAGLAVACTIFILPLIGPLAPSSDEEPATSIAGENIPVGTAPRSGVRGEDTPLLYSAIPPPIPPPPPAQNPKYDPNRM